jgi:hypothetical protein
MMARSVPLLLGLSLAAAAPAPAQAIPDSTMVAHFIDVGQGDAALLECSFFQRRTDLESTQFGHPRRGTVDLLQDAISRRRSTPKRAPVADGVEDFQQVTVRDAIYATGWDGTIRIEATTGGRYTVRVEKQQDPPACGAGGGP